MKLSNQAVGAVMMALQKGILEQTDVSGLLKDFDIVESVDGLVVMNPPTVSVAPEPAQETVTAKRKPRKKTTTKKRAPRKKKTTKKVVLSDSGDLQEVK
jgi:hypothetical protein